MSEVEQLGTPITAGAIGLNTKKVNTELVELIKQAIKDNIASASNNVPELLHCHAEYLNALVSAYRTFN